TVVASQVVVAAAGGVVVTDLVCGGVVRVGFAVTHFVGVVRLLVECGLLGDGVVRGPEQVVAVRLDRVLVRTPEGGVAVGRVHDFGGEDVSDDLMQSHVRACRGV